MKKKYKDQGFSLVELSIVLVVIGLIIGGVLKAQDLIESARLKSVLSQINEYRIAVGAFLDRYDALPGDFHQASQLIDPALRNGNNDGAVTGAGLDPASEAFQFWQHLGLAGFISPPGRQNQVGPTGFGLGAPGVKIGGGITVAHQPKPDMPGNWFLLGAQNGNQGNGALLTPLQAMSIDKKADNGDPKSGKVRALTGENAEGGNCLTHEGQYNTNNTQKACVLYFAF